MINFFTYLRGAVNSCQLPFSIHSIKTLSRFGASPKGVSLFLLSVLPGFLPMFNQIVGLKRSQLKFPNTLAKPVLALIKPCQLTTCKMKKTFWLITYQGCTGKERFRTRMGNLN